MAASSRLTETWLEDISGDSEDEADLSKAIQIFECKLRSQNSQQNKQDDQAKCMLFNVLKFLQPTSIEKFCDVLYQKELIQAPLELDPDQPLEQKIGMILKEMDKQTFCNIMGCLRQLPEIQERKKKAKLL